MVSKLALRCLVVLEIALLFIYAYAAHQEPSANLQPFGVYDSAPQDNQGRKDSLRVTPGLHSRNNSDCQWLAAA